MGLGGGWTLQRVRDYVGNPEVVLLDPLDWAVISAGPDGRRLDATAILRFSESTCLVKAGEWHLGLITGPDRVTCAFGGMNLEEAMREL
jgi:hypothetical protein